VTLGLVLDGSGFVKRSRMFEGNVVESRTLADMLETLDAPQGAMVIMDRGIATQANIDWLSEHEYRYLVVSRERKRCFDRDQAVAVTTASKQTIHIQRILDKEGKEVRLYCHSEQRQEKEKAITSRFCKLFEAGLARISESLAKPHGIKRQDKVLERIGRLKEKSRGVGRHYKINLTLDDQHKKVIAITWEQKPVEGTMLTDPGVYCLRTNELNWDEATLWRTYTMLTDVEAVFRSLKSELGLRPIYHHKEERTEGHLFITVLAYQAVQVIRQRLKSADINLNWKSLREIFQVQRRITITFNRKDGRALHVRKATMAEPELKQLYKILQITDSPGGIKKMIY
jgi:transposase